MGFCHDTLGLLCIGFDDAASVQSIVWLPATAASASTIVTGTGSLYIEPPTSAPVAAFRFQRVSVRHDRMVKGVGHLGNDESMEVGGREFDPRPGHYSRMSF